MTHPCPNPVPTPSPAGSTPLPRSLDPLPHTPHPNPPLAPVISPPPPFPSLSPTLGMDAGGTGQGEEKGGGGAARSGWERAGKGQGATKSSSSKGHISLAQWVWEGGTGGSFPHALGICGRVTMGVGWQGRAQRDRGRGESPPKEGRNPSGVDMGEMFMIPPPLPPPPPVMGKGGKFARCSEQVFVPLAFPSLGVAPFDRETKGRNGGILPRTVSRHFLAAPPHALTRFASVAGTCTITNIHPSRPLNRISTPCDISSE